MAIDNDTLKLACKRMEELLDQYKVMEGSLSVRVPDYGAFKCAIFDDKAFPFAPVYIPFAMVASELQCEALVQKDLQAGKRSDAGFAAFMKRKLLSSLEEMLSPQVKGFLEELRKPENMRIEKPKTEEEPATGSHNADDIPKALAILNVHLRKHAAQPKPDYDAFASEVRKWTEETYGSPFGLGTAIALTERQCEAIMKREHDTSNDKARQANLRYNLLQCLRKQLSGEILEYVDSAKQKVPDSIIQDLPWH